jgi:hypothetical protein
MPDSRGVPPAPRPPSASRVRDALLGGRRNLEADRALADRLEVRFGGIAQAAAEARAFTGRAVTWCALQGIAQFIVPEPGLPLPGGAAEVARAVIPGARVAYADTEPSAYPYARREAARDDATAAVRGISAGDPSLLLADPALRAVIDLAEPACAVLAMTAHLMPAAQAAAMVAGFAGALAPGSALIISAWVPHPGPAAESFTAMCLPVRAFRHAVADIEGWLSGLDLVKPGVTDVRGWRAGMPDPGLPPHPVTMTAGAVAIIP